jgi:hypothetical protein
MEVGGDSAGKMVCMPYIPGSPRVDLDHDPREPHDLEIHGPMTYAIITGNVTQEGFEHGHED